MGKPFDLVLGRKTYDIFAAYWPSAPEDPGGKPFNDATKYVASRSRPVLECEHVGHEPRETSLRASRCSSVKTSLRSRSSAAAI